MPIGTSPFYKLLPMSIHPFLVSFLFGICLIPLHVAFFLSFHFPFSVLADLTHALIYADFIYVKDIKESKYILKK